MSIFLINTGSVLIDGRSENVSFVRRWSTFSDSEARLPATDFSLEVCWSQPRACSSEFSDIALRSVRMLTDSLFRCTLGVPTSDVSRDCRRSVNASSHRRRRGTIGVSVSIFESLIGCLVDFRHAPVAELETERANILQL